MKTPDRIWIECTPGGYLFNIVDEDGMVLFAEKYLMNESGDLRRIREFAAPAVREVAQVNEIREKIAEAAPSLFSLAQLLHNIEERAVGGGIIEFS